MVWRKVLFQVGRFLLRQGARIAFNYVDKNKDGSLSKKEINGVVEDIKRLAQRFK